MPTIQVSTNLRCAACVQSITPSFDAEPGITRWSADVSTPQKLLTVEGPSISRERVVELLRAKGYDAQAEAQLLTLGGVKTSSPVVEKKSTYFPLVLILVYLLAVVVGYEASVGRWNIMRMMNHFMAGFFLVFSLFKMLDVPSFASSFRMYDLAGKYVPGYAYAYPFIELILGLGYLMPRFPFTTNLITLVVMLIGTISIILSLTRQQKIRCACLGTVFNLPISYVTLVEDVVMLVMAGVMLGMM
jgi:cation transport ATPase